MRTESKNLDGSPSCKMMMGKEGSQSNQGV